MQQQKILIWGANLSKLNSLYGTKVASVRLLQFKEDLHRWKGGKSCSIGGNVQHMLPHAKCM